MYSTELTTIMHVNNHMLQEKSGAVFFLSSNNCWEEEIDHC